MRKRLSKELSDRELRSHPEMELQFRSVLSGVFRANISCKESEWTGTCRSNLAKIQRGELHVKNNSFEEGGRSVVSTSQLEGFHSALKNC
ncbi:LOW QUALITY PROTEIN: hypothetical protein PHMEG_00038053 [Phytophthora megakarya]|uniref:Uncharacterized protein n=1 Tax=Phytophthora megakarya TaxID=4795 RepID=A0A225UIF6_9STRA|nr:LOW QUALITY PROTEIN: hypothetical protein PHMEG_00038053 [Phytophthora megakarya]